jgi:hypothetical protein
VDNSAVGAPAPLQRRADEQEQEHAQQTQEGGARVINATWNVRHRRSASLDEDVTRSSRQRFLFFFQGEILSQIVIYTLREKAAREKRKS